MKMRKESTMSKKTSLTAAALSLLLIPGLVGLSACKKASENLAERRIENAIEKATGGKAQVDLSGGGIKVKTAEGESSLSTSSEWPKDLPEGVPLFTFGKVQGVTRVADAAKTGWNIILGELETGAIEKYTEALKAAGWTIGQTMSMGEGGLIQATKDKLGVMVMFNQDKTASLTVTNNIEQ